MEIQILGIYNYRTIETCQKTGTQYKLVRYIYNTKINNITSELINFERNTQSKMCYTNNKYYKHKTERMQQNKNNN